MAERYCIYCDSVISEGASVCSHCGRSQSRAKKPLSLLALFIGAGFIAFPLIIGLGDIPVQTMLCFVPGGLLIIMGLVGLFTP